MVKIKAFSRVAERGRRPEFVTDSAILNVMVSGLVQLNPDANYELWGGTNNHPGPGENMTAEQSALNVNHWGTQTTINALQNIARQAILPPQPIPPPPPPPPGVPPPQYGIGLRLIFNDISLPRGGLFDINCHLSLDPNLYPHGYQCETNANVYHQSCTTPGLWHVPHITHRKGRNVDLWVGNVPVGSRDALKTIIRQNGGNILEEDNCWHLTF